MFIGAVDNISSADPEVKSYRSDSQRYTISSFHIHRCFEYFEYIDCEFHCGFFIELTLFAAKTMKKIVKF